MKTKTIKKSIEITAPAEKIWEVLFDDKFNKIWFAEFSEGTRAETTWKIDSKVAFIDPSECGLVGKIVINKPYETLLIEYSGQIVNGVEDYTSDTAQAINGSIEVYKLSAKNGNTLLEIEADMAEDYFDMMASAWDTALIKIKDLSEGVNA